jgi:DNA helicase-2/ATP-dependent DNA helicase PcrA
MYGNYDVSSPSRFLDDIPEGLLAGQIAKKKSDAESAFARMTTWDADPHISRRGRSETRPHKRETVQTESRYRTGQRVKHPSFGEGMIIESKGSGDDETVVIAFEGAGVKRLAANMVELKVLKG